MLQPPTSISSRDHLEHTSVGNYRRVIARRLRERVGELEEVILERLSSVAGAGSLQDNRPSPPPRAVLRAALDYGCHAIEREEGPLPPLPHPVIAQARTAGSIGLPLPTLLIRYLTGYSVFKDFVLKEQEVGGLPLGPPSRKLLSSIDLVFERLVRVVSQEYEREIQARAQSRESRHLTLITELLAGERMTVPVSYDFDLRHIGVVGSGPGISSIIRDLAAALNSRCLVIHPSPDDVWAWLGTAEGFRAEHLIDLLPSSMPKEARIAIGEPAVALLGWRRTHRQAKAAFGVAAQGALPILRYAEVPLLASAAQDQLVQASLREIYLAPLTSGGDDGKTLRKTLRTYFAAGRNGSSAAAALGITRQTVALRLQTVEEKLGQPLAQCGDALHLALQLEELGYIGASY